MIVINHSFITYYYTLFTLISLFSLMISRPKRNSRSFVNLAKP